ncbi:MAG: hypothetical protein MK212_02765 [Saprospiraceae bacterium]|nr:hypothetical protein [Saprospiraceae bacterium]
MQIKIFLALAALLFSLDTYAQKYSNEFLSIGVDARAHGMGKSVVASINDVTAGYLNPAGLARMDTNNVDLQLALMHAEWFGGIGKYDYAAFAMPLPNQKRYLGFSFIRFGVDGIPNTLSLYEADGTVNYENVTKFTAADYAFMLHYAQEIGKTGLAIGVTPKVVHRKVGPFASSWGFGVDLGVQYKLKKDWNFGLMLRDITTTFNAWKFNFSDAEKQVLGITGNDIPIQTLEITRPQLILGAAYAKQFQLGKRKEGKKDKYFGLLAEIDFTMTTDGRRNMLISGNPISMDPSVGLELNYNTLIYLRTGINNFQQFTDIQNNKKWAVQPNFGVGFRIFKFRIDYAITNLGGNSGVLYSHLVSAKLDINYDFIKKNIDKAQ